VALGQVKDRAAAWVAWSMLAIFVVGCGAAVTLEVTARGLGPGNVALPLAFTGFMVVGAVVVAHRPGNAVGWIFSAVGLLAATGWLAMEYAIYAYVTRPRPLPGAIWAAWYQQQWWFPMYALIFVATPLLFPTGRLLSARWRPFAATAALVTVALVLLAALQPTIKLQDQDYWVDNPIGLAGTWRVAHPMGWSSAVLVAATGSGGAIALRCRSATTGAPIGWRRAGPAWTAWTCMGRTTCATPSRPGWRMPPSRFG
jgi:hypothetical protein